MPRMALTWVYPCKPGALDPSSQGNSSQWGNKKGSRESLKPRDPTALPLKTQTKGFTLKKSIPGLPASFLDPLWVYLFDIVFIHPTTLFVSNTSKNWCFPGK